VNLPAVLAVDGGGSKVDAALVADDGTPVGAVRIRSSGHDGPHSDSYLEGVAAAVDAVCREAAMDPVGRPLASLGIYCLAGADLPADDRRILRWVSRHRWTQDDVLRNDTFAILRAGTDRTWGVGVVCGYGTNCSAVAPDGRTFRFAAIGDISGDWGGGMDIGRMALWHAVRAEDGRGDETELAGLVPSHFALKRPRHVMEAIHLGRMDMDRLAELPPVVFRAAGADDMVARGILDRQADEIVAMAGTAIRKLRMTKLDVPVVLGGGIFHNDFGPFFDRIENGLRRVAPDVRVTVLSAPPVAGAALMGLDRMGAPDASKARLRAGLTHERLARTLSAAMRED
jgi:N-acetylglucosamine kinase-like BadF-type ATPase